MIKLYINSAVAEDHFKIVKPLVQKRIDSVLTTGYTTYNKVRRYPSNDLRDYLTLLRNDDELRTLVSAPPSAFEGIIDYMSGNLIGAITSGSDDNLVLWNIFISHSYNKKEFKKLDFIKRISLGTCPYCNRSYIYHLPEQYKVKPQLDHFYPQSIYPFFGVSFYNLIPCCQTCNGLDVKADNDPVSIGLINPYLLEEGQFEFTYKIVNINFMNPLADKTSVELRFKNAIRGHLNTFKLHLLYAQHADHVSELIIKSKVAYSERYREYLRTYTGFNLSNAEIDRLILGNYSTITDTHKRPLSKLYQDIGRKLGLIE